MPTTPSCGVFPVGFLTTNSYLARNCLNSTPEFHWRLQFKDLTPDFAPPAVIVGVQHRVWCAWENCLHSAPSLCDIIRESRVSWQVGADCSITNDPVSHETRVTSGYLSETFSAGTKLMCICEYWFSHHRMRATLKFSKDSNKHMHRSVSTWKLIRSQFPLWSPVTPTGTKLALFRHEVRFGPLKSWKPSCAM